MLKWARHVSFRSKIVLAPLCAIVCMVGVGLIGYVANNSLSGSLLALGETRVPKIIRAAALEQRLANIHILVNQSLAWEGAGFRAEKIAQLDTRIAVELADYGGRLQAAADEPGLDATERDQLAVMLAEFDKYRGSATEALDIKTGMLANAVFHMTTMESAFRRLNVAAQALIAHEHAQSGAAVVDARALAAKNQVAIVGGFALALGAALAIAALMARATHADFREKNAALTCAYKVIEEASLTDPLTGLRNRRFLEQQLDADISLCVRRYEQWRSQPGGTMPVDADLVFFMVDIDHFKVLNDTHGHAAGDRVLAQMRQRLQQAFRESDYLVRWGGEEFLVVARGTRRSEAVSIAERIRRAVGGQAFELDGGLQLLKTCSVGFACFPFLPDRPRELGWAEVVEVADQALYMAKHAGRDTWVGLESGDATGGEAVRQWLAGGQHQPPQSGLLRVLRQAADPA